MAPAAIEGSSLEIGLVMSVSDMYWIMLNTTCFPMARTARSGEPDKRVEYPGFCQQVTRGERPDGQLFARRVPSSAGVCLTPFQHRLISRDARHRMTGAGAKAKDTLHLFDDFPLPEDICRVFTSLSTPTGKPLVDDTVSLFGAALSTLWQNH
ncbi:uncharacterized protein BYT42DRAFT_610518 [Radiomyces spectabilis]|uniref:uncharacterized protein n=1 Tax=Radiomyces spectabilis TaxID=64574 RepID=UPI00222098C0|nr:uncharacterized protein BYT42DRAFT_610518 [Radiomyces spectabilis]KAI8391273.1 hypothetical protein BYT42DRAFT_610518 [Radiomyces spectabilis]